MVSPSLCCSAFNASVLVFLTIGEESTREKNYPDSGFSDFNLTYGCDAGLCRGGDNLCGWPDSFPGKMYGMMIRNYHAEGRGYFLGNYYGHVQSCHAIPPKTPWWAGN